MLFYHCGTVYLHYVRVTFSHGGTFSLPFQGNTYISMLYKKKKDIARHYRKQKHVFY